MPAVSHSKRIGFWSGIVIFALILVFADLDPDRPEVTRMAAVASLMAVWWIFEAIPLAATALLPLALFPFLGIASGKVTAPIYFNSTIFLFVGGFMIALAMERWHLHKRIALGTIRALGGGPDRLVLSVMVATAFLSMWISNTATAIMMLAIGLAVLSAEEEKFGREKTRKLSAALLLGIAYSASIGGLATLVGTPPNLSFARIFEQSFPEAEPMSFARWFLFGLPFCLIMLVFVWFLLTKILFRTSSEITLSKGVIADEYRALGKIRFEEVAIFCVFIATAFLWIFRKDITVGSFAIPGWGDALPIGSLLDDGTVAVAMALLLFLIPSRNPTPSESEDGDGSVAPTSSRGILTVDVFHRIPWHIILLFGGGFALAKGFQTSGLSEFVGQKFASLKGTSPVLLVAAICTFMTFLTELTSNTATTEMVLPILSSIGVAAGTNPLLFMIPATLSASCAFMMPVATPPNAIVFGSGRLRITQMLYAGIIVNVAGILLITVLFLTLGFAIFGIDPAVFPDWAKAEP